MNQLKVKILSAKRLAAAVFAAAVFTMFLLPGEASAFNLGAGAGVFIPGSDMSESFDPGYNIYAYAGFNMVPAILDFRIQADYYASDGKESNVDYSFNAIGGEALLVLAPTFIPVIKPYVGAGWGVYNSTVEVGDDSETKWGNGFVAVAGVGVEVLIVRIGLDGKYFINTVDGDDYGGYGAGLSVTLAL